MAMMSSKRSGFSRFKLSRMPVLSSWNTPAVSALRQQLVGRACRRAAASAGRSDAAAALDQVHGLLEHGQRLEAEEVELHQARRLDHLQVELGDRSMFDFGSR